MHPQPHESQASPEAALADAEAEDQALPVPVRWMPALFRHTRVDARQYRHEVLLAACAERVAAHGGDREAWLAALSTSPAAGCPDPDARPP